MEGIMKAQRVSSKLDNRAHGRRRVEREGERREEGHYDHIGQTRLMREDERGVFQGDRQEKYRSYPYREYERRGDSGEGEYRMERDRYFEREDREDELEEGSRRGSRGVCSSDRRERESSYEGRHCPSCSCDIRDTQGREERWSGRECDREEGLYRHHRRSSEPRLGR